VYFLGPFPVGCLRAVPINYRRPPLSRAQIDHIVIPPLSLEETLRSANLSDYLRLLRRSGMWDQVSRLQGVTLFAPVQGTIRQLQNYSAAGAQQPGQPGQPGQPDQTAQQGQGQQAAQAAQPGQPAEEAEEVRRGRSLRIPQEMLQQIIKANVVPGVFYSPGQTNTDGNTQTGHTDAADRAVWQIR
jgi:hypothetical protein